ncbi:MAG TPA: acetyltransferase [Longimicrobiales bacterium]
MAHARRSLLVWGAGGHGRVVAEIARAAGHDVLGFVDADTGWRSHLAEAGGARLVLAEEELLEWLCGEWALPTGIDAVAVAVGDNRIRLGQVRRLGALLAPPLIHPTAVISPSATLRDGTVVGPLAVVNTGASVGRGVIVNTGAVVGHDSVVQDGAHVGGRVMLTGGVHVGERAFIGAGAIVLPRVHIGADVVVGAGAVVLHDLADGVRAVGVPARLIEEGLHGIGSTQDLSLTAAPDGI